MKTIGQRMLTAREAVTPRMSRDKATQELAARFPAERITPKTLQRLEGGDLTALNIPRLSALCEVYGTKLKDVCPELVSESRALSDLLVRQSAYFQESLLAS